MESDPFDDLLGLEEQFYNEGYQLGSDDGAKAGRIEGRVFGLEKGFEKYVESGRLHGKSLVWAGRLPGKRNPDRSISHSIVGKNTSESMSSNTGRGATGSALYGGLPDLADNPRLEKHVRTLYALTEPASLSTENTEDSVSDFDDRLKRSLAKLKIIERLIGEDGAMMFGEGGATAISGPVAVDWSGETNIEDISVLKARH